MENLDMPTIEDLLLYFDDLHKKLMYRLEVKISQIPEIAKRICLKDFRKVFPVMFELPSITKFEQELVELINGCSEQEERYTLICQCLNEYYKIEPYLLNSNLLFDYNCVTDFIERDSLKPKEAQVYEKKLRRANAEKKGEYRKIIDRIEVIDEKYNDPNLKREKILALYQEFMEIENDTTTFDNLKKVRENLLELSHLPDKELIKLSEKPISAISIRYCKYVNLLREYAQKNKDSDLINFIDYSNYAESLLKVILDCAHKRKVHINDQKFVERIIKIDTALWNISTLTKLYKLLTERKFIEAEKCEAFISIFYETYSDFHQFPIKWLALEKRGGNDASSNQTLLYNLLAAIKDWEQFQKYYTSILQNQSGHCFPDYVLVTDKKTWASCFVLVDGSQINYRNLRIRPNKEALKIINDLIKTVLNI